MIGAMKHTRKAIALLRVFFIIKNKILRRKKSNERTKVNAKTAGVCRRAS